MTEIDPAIAAGLDRLVPSYSDAVSDWDDVLRRPDSDRRPARRFRPTRQRVVAALVFVIGVGATTAILLHTSGSNSVSSNSGGSCALTVRYRARDLLWANHRGGPPARTPRRFGGDPGLRPGGGSQTIEVANLRESLRGLLSSGLVRSTRS